VLNIVIPMAGRGSRFADAGYIIPKPFIPLGGRPMIEWVVENLKPAQPHRFIFLCLQDHLEQFPEFFNQLPQLAPGAVVVPVAGVTEGAACTVLLAREYIDNQDPLMIANSDQYVDMDINRYLAILDDLQLAGLIMTFRADDPKWSYARLDTAGWVTEVVEKRVVSNEATVGIYNFARGTDFVSGADRMIQAGQRVNGEFYVAPVYNSLIAAGALIRTCFVGEELEQMFGLGTPEDFCTFQQSQVFKQRTLPGGSG